jgi:branched-subunit amino acid ABC-type transport system permease component
MTILYRTATIVRFLHGEFFMAGALAVYVCCSGFGILFLESAFISIPFLFAIGVAIDRCPYRK